MFSDWSDFIEKIKQEKGLSSADLAKKLDVRPQLLNDIEKGRSKNPSSDFLIRLIHRLGLNPNYLIGEAAPLFLEEGNGKESDSEMPSIKVHNPERFKNKNLFEIPFLTQEEALKFEPKQEIPEPKANSGEYPDYDFVLAPRRILEYSTDLRAFEVFDSRMFPVFKSGDIAIIQATGWNGNGIYLYRIGRVLHVSYAGQIKGVEGLMLITEDGTKIAYDAQGFEPIGRVRAVVKDLFAFDWIGGTQPPRESYGEM
jgi:transcriptional regulator with XRE-family HTH domain